MTPKFVIKFNNKYLMVKDGKAIWCALWQANTYSSKYAAKKHLRMVDDVPENVQIVLHNSV